jgi:hypothetical protein
MKALSNGIRNGRIPWGLIILVAVSCLAILFFFTPLFSRIDTRNAGEIRAANGLGINVDGNITMYNVIGIPGEQIAGAGGGVIDTVISEETNASVLASLGSGIPLRIERKGVASVRDEALVDASGLIPGDILLGRCRLSPVPDWNPVDNWTHVALYIGNDRLMVSSNPVQDTMMTTLRSWMYPKMTWVTYLRVVTADDEVRNKAVEWAKGRKDDPYDTSWFSKNADENSWYCSEFIWAAYMHASDGRINLEHEPDTGGISPNEIYVDDDTVVIGGHYEQKPDTILSLLSKVIVLIIIAGGVGMLMLDTVAFPGVRRRRRTPTL